MNYQPTNTVQEVKDIYEDLAWSDTESDSTSIGDKDEVEEQSDNDSDNARNDDFNLYIVATVLAVNGPLLKITKAVKLIQLVMLEISSKQSSNKEKESSEPEGVMIPLWEMVKKFRRQFSKKFPGTTGKKI